MNSQQSVKRYWDGRRKANRITQQETGLFSPDLQRQQPFEVKEIIIQDNSRLPLFMKVFNHNLQKFVFWETDFSEITELYDMSSCKVVSRFNN